MLHWAGWRCKRKKLENEFPPFRTLMSRGKVGECVKQVFFLPLTHVTAWGRGRKPPENVLKTKPRHVSAAAWKYPDDRKELDPYEIILFCIAHSYFGDISSIFVISHSPSIRLKNVKHYTADQQQNNSVEEMQHYLDISALQVTWHWFTIIITIIWPIMLLWKYRNGPEHFESVTCSPCHYQLLRPQVIKPLNILKLII